MRLHPFLTAVAASLLLVTPQDVEDSTFDSDGVPIRFTLQGEGDAPLLLLHGFAANLETMQGLIPALARDFHVIAVDVRGHGRSGKPHDPDHYGMEMVEDVVRLLDHLGIEEAHVLGYSMGAMITLKLATTHPDRVVSAVAGGYGWPESSPEGDGFMDRVAESLERGEGFGPLFESLTPEGQEPPPSGQLQAIEEMLLATNDPLALAAAARGFRRLALTEEELRSNEVPVLAIVGELDPLGADVERMRGVMNRLEIVVLPGADHMITGMRPAFLENVRAFLAGTRDGGPDPGEPAEPVEAPERGAGPRHPLPCDSAWGRALVGTGT